MGKSIFKNTHVLNIKKATKICDKFDVVSFDVFDTLIKRNVDNPKDIYKLLDKIAAEKGINDFLNLRTRVEQELREYQSFINIDDIYNKISSCLDEEISLKLKKTEIDLELSYCQSNYEIKELYDLYKKMGKRIIAVSDMYLTTDIIKRILEKNDIVVDKIYVSCDCKAKKSDGSLFDYVLKEEKISNKRIIHIGDNWRADYIGAKKQGIKTMHVKTKIDIIDSKKYIKKMKEPDKYKTYINIINNNIYNQKDYYSKFGFSIIGPIVYNYCNWLKDQCKKNNINKIFFFSRDGYVLKKAFDKLYPEQFETKYIYFSRRAIRVPFNAIYSSYEDIMNFFPKTKMTTTRVYLENFGLNANEYVETLKKYDLTINDNIYYDDLFSNKKYRLLFEELHKDIIKVANSELNVLKQYLNQENFRGKIGVVDVGWHNSMQFYLEKIIESNNKETEIYGFYVGKQSGEKKVSNSMSYLREREQDEYVNSTISYIGLIESVFLSNEGSTISYSKSGGKIVPNLLEYEYKNEDFEYNAFNSIRNGIFEFIDIVNKLIYFKYYALSGYDAYLPIKMYGICPNKKDIEYFSNFRYLSEELVYFANAKNLLYYIFHVRDLKKDLLKARWKIGFMKKVFKINLPYYQIYKKMRG